MKKLIIYSSSIILYSLFIITPLFAQVDLEGPVSGDMTQIISNIIKFILGLVGVLALIFFIYGGITWITSAGNAEQVKKGKSTLIWAVMGLIICFLAYSLVTFVINESTKLGSSTTTGGGGGGGTGENPDDAPCIQAHGTCLDNCSSECKGAGMKCDSESGLCGGDRRCCKFNPVCPGVCYPTEAGCKLTCIGSCSSYSETLCQGGGYCCEECPGGCFQNEGQCQTSCYGGSCGENNKLCSSPNALWCCFK